MGRPKLHSTRTHNVCALQSLHSSGTVTKGPFIHVSRLKKDIKALIQQTLKSRKCVGSICLTCYQLSPHEIHRLVSSTDKTTQSTSEESMEINVDMDMSETSPNPCRDTSSIGVNTTINSADVFVLSPKTLRQDLETLSPEIRAQIAFHLAAIERPNVRSDVKNLMKAENRTLSSLSDLCRQDYLKDLNPVLTSFLHGLHGHTEQAKWFHSERAVPNSQSGLVESKATIYRVAKVAESCMGLTSSIAVLPFHIREGILMYNFTGSKTAIALLASTTPQGSYPTIRKWFDQVANSDTNSAIPTEQGDILLAFDNNQVIQKRWQICVNNKAVSNVVTMIISFDIDPQGSLQFQERLKPSNWMWKNLTDEKVNILRQAHQNIVHQATRYQKHLHPWLSKIIKQVANEQEVSSVAGKCTDVIDQEIKKNNHSKSYKTCQKCGHDRILKKKWYCDKCGERVTTVKKTTEKTNSDNKTNTKQKTGPIEAHVKLLENGNYHVSYVKPKKPTEYDHLPNLHPDEPPGVRIGQPLFVNPCSYNAVAEVFRNIGIQAGIRKYGGTREWAPIVCDGLPYILGFQLIERMFVCNLCPDVSMHGDMECSAHRQEHINQTDEINFTREFDWVLLQPGPGHIEMNMLRSFVKFSWLIFWEGLVEVFNFRSEVAKKSAHAVSDHHKGWTLARIARESLAKELVLPYVREQMKEVQPDLSVNSYLAYAKHASSENANYFLMYQLVFEILDSIFQYRAGVRTGDISMMESGKAFYSRMWCARNHPMYRQLSVNDSIMTACMPPEVFCFMQKTKSINLSAGKYNGEGADFRLEEFNKVVQHWLPAAPKPKDWNNSCANLQNLAKLKDATTDEMGVKDPKQYSSKSASDISDQVIAYRAAIRDNEFISLDKAGNGESLFGFHGEPLDYGLIDFAKEASKKELVFLNNFILHKEQGCFLQRLTVPFQEPPVFVTEQEKKEYFDIGNKTCKESARLIKLKIAEIQNEDMQATFQQAYDTDIGGTTDKSKYFYFFHLVQEYLHLVSDDTTETHTDYDFEPEPEPE